MALFSTPNRIIQNSGINFGNNIINQAVGRGIDAVTALIGVDLLNVWSIVDEVGQKVFDFDSFLTSSVNSESKITQMPVELGSFATYNLVKTPLDISVSLVKQGSSYELSAYVDALLSFVDNLTLLSIVTPEKEYKNMKLVKVNFERSAENGTDRIIADCHFLEVRQVVSQYGNARLSKKQSRGQQQPKETSILGGILG